MPSIGKRCHELRISDGNSIWRLVYRIDKTEIVVFDVFKKKTNKTPDNVIEACKARIKVFDQ